MQMHNGTTRLVQVWQRASSSATPTSPGKQTARLLLVHVHFNTFISTLVLYFKGVGLFGALCQGNLSDCASFTPIKIDNTSSEDSKIVKMTKASAGYGHTAFLSEEGHIYVAGRPYDLSALFRLNNIYRYF